MCLLNTSNYPSLISLYRLSIKKKKNSRSINIRIKIVNVEFLNVNISCQGARSPIIYVLLVLPPFADFKK